MGTLEGFRGSYSCEGGIGKGICKNDCRIKIRQAVVLTMLADEYVLKDFDKILVIFKIVSKVAC